MMRRSWRLKRASTASSKAPILPFRENFRGDLKATGLVRILEGSQVNAKVEANAVEIGGRFQGNVHTESLRLLGPARATGTFHAKKLSVEEGGQLDGDFEIGEGPPERLAEKKPV